MNQLAWAVTMSALGFIDGWLACWWVGLIGQKRRRELEIKYLEDQWNSWQEDT